MVLRPFFLYIWQKLFAGILSEYCNLVDSGSSLPAFPSTTNLKLNISVNPKTIKKIITGLESSKVSSPDCIVILSKIFEGFLLDLRTSFFK